jgi:hypothetical protein
MSALSSTKFHFWSAGAALLVVALGCGGSTDSPTGTGASGGSGGSGASGGSDGTGGTGGSGGSTGGTGGTGGASGGQPDGGDVICGGMVCPPTMLGMTSIPACCTTQNTCGVSAAGQCFDPNMFDAGGPRFEAGVGVPDPNCASLMVGGFPLTGCCMTDNTCGFSSPLGGCTSLETLRSLNLPGLNLPDGGPMACVYPPP